MRTFKVRGNWRDLLLMSRADDTGPDESRGSERPGDHRVGSAMIDAADALPLHPFAGLALGGTR